jgi:DNA-binding NtrC family response regulator
VLIADDEPNIFELTATIITEMGLTPLTLTDGTTAIKAMENPMHISVVSFLT